MNPIRLLPLACALVACGGEEPARWDLCWEGLSEPGDPAATVLASNQEGAFAIAADKDRVYWTTTSRVMALAKGGENPTVLAEHQSSPVQIAVDSGHVYWTNLSNGTVMRVGKDGAALQAIAVGEEEPFGIAVGATTTGDGPLTGEEPSALDNAAVFWTDREAGALRSSSLTPPSPSDLPRTLATGQLYPLRAAIDESAVYWVDADGGAIRSVPLEGGEVRTIVVTPSPEAVVVDETSIYWTSETEGIVGRAFKDGSEPTTLALGQWAPGALAVDAEHVYWTSSLECRVNRVPKSGGTPEVVASKQPYPEGIAVDDEHVYWVNFQAATVMRASK